MFTTKNNHVYSIKTLFSLLIAFGILLSACSKKEFLEPIQPEEEPSSELTQETEKGNPFLYDPGNIEPIVYTPFNFDILEMAMFFTPEDYVTDLLNAIDFSYQQGNEVVVFMGLVPIQDFNQAQGPAFHFAPQAANILNRPYSPFQPDGFYELVNLLMVDTEGDQNLYDLQTVDTEAVKKGTQKGGICATLAIAHSLVHRNHIIPEDGRGEWDETSETSDGKTVWNPDFLKKIYEASGDSDGSRGLSDSEMEEAHTADWSSDWDMDKSKDMTTVETPGNKPSASELSEWCKELKKFMEEERDDCILRTRGTMTYKDLDGTTKTKRVGHAMTINSVEEKDGKCVIKVVDTSKQDPKKDWEDVPYNPGDQEWTVGTDGSSISNNNPWGTSIVWDEIAFFCFDEDPKRDDVKPTDRGTPGTALQ